MPFRFLTLVAPCVLLLLVACTPEKRLHKGSQPPNVIFFLVDDLGWTDVGCYGSSFYETPNIDRFATEGVKFTNAYAACHVCSPTRASILSGRYPARNRMTDWIPGRRDFPFQKFLNVQTRQFLPFEETTLAEALKAHGYTTSAIGKWHLGAAPSGPEAHGFDEHLPLDWTNGWPNGSYHAPYKMNGLEAPKGEYLTDRLTDEAMDFIDRNREGPFFLYLAHFAVHDPIQGRKDLVEKYNTKLAATSFSAEGQFILEGNPDDPEPLSRAYLDQAIKDPSFARYGVLPQHTVKVKQYQDNTEFAGMLEAVDQSLGRILEKLNALGIDDNTIVIFFSDNGGMAAMNVGRPERTVPKEKLDIAFSTSNLPLRGAKGWLYEGGIREPCIVKWPGKGKAGTVSDVPVISTDFFPSILDMAGLPLLKDQHKDGVSIVPLLQGAKSLDRDAIYWHFPHYSNHGMQPPSGAIRKGDYKLIEYFENGTVQLFNLREDIGEQNDLAATMPEKARELKEQLHRWRESVDAEMPELNPDYDPSQYPWSGGN
ncbi:MAG: sulfatase [Verrucomicrobiae bacterium]|nr:sulfatase [Verrucomicrobiae bacterium]